MIYAIPLFIVAVLIAGGAVSSVSKIGVEREPITRDDAARTVVMGLVIAGVCLASAVHLA